MIVLRKFDVMRKILNENKGYISSSEIREYNISRSYFLEFIKDHNLVRVSHGLYMSQDTWKDDMYILQKRYPNAIFSHETAAYLLDLSEREPFTFSITLKSTHGSSRLANEDIVVYKIKGELFDIGCIKTLTPMGHEVRVYNAERTICDLIRNRNTIEIQEFQSILKTYLQSKERNIPELVRYAKAFSIDRILKQYMEVLL